MPAEHHRGPQLKRRKRDENRIYRRTSLLDAAIQTVAHHDIAGATVERICDNAGASRGLIAHYFDSKESLLLGALQHWFDSALAIKKEIAENDSQSALNRLHGIAHSTFRPPSYSWENAAAWQAFTNASRYDKAFAKPIRQASRYVIRLTTPLYREAATEVGVELDPDLAASGLYILTDGIWNSLATGRDNMTSARAISLCSQYISGSLASTNNPLADN